MPQTRTDPRDGCAFQLLLGLQLLVPGVAFLGLRRFRTASAWLVLGVLGWLVFLGWLVGALAIIDATTSGDRRRRRPASWIQALGVLVPGSSHLASAFWARGIGFLMIAALAVAFGALRSGDGVAMHDNVSGWTLVVDGEMSVLEEPQPRATPAAVMLTDVHRYALEDITAPVTVRPDRPVVLDTSLGSRWVIQPREPLTLAVDQDTRTAYLKASDGSSGGQTNVLAALGLVWVIGLLAWWDLRGATRPGSRGDGTEADDANPPAQGDIDEDESSDVVAPDSDHGEVESDDNGLSDRDPDDDEGSAPRS